MEQQAAAYLIEKGYTILERNYYAGHKEIDLVALEGGYLVFVEVKYRKNEKMGRPEEQITWKKMENLREAAKKYIYNKRLPQDTPCRFDVVCMLDAEISLIQNAF